MTKQQVISRLRAMLCDAKDQDDYDTILAAIRLLGG